MTFARAPAAPGALPRRRRSPAAALQAALARDGLLVLLLCGFAALLLQSLNRLLSTDGWLALVAGRLVAREGLPTHDTLTIVAQGRRWIDQQWLGQLALYGLEQAGGLRLLLLAHVTLVVGAVAGAVALARARGASPRAVAVVLVPALLPLAFTSGTLRTQSLVYLPFVGLLAVLTRPAPPGGVRLVLVLGLIAFWANVHGSVVLAAALVSARGLAELLRGGARWRALALALLPWPLVLASPYGSSLLPYFRDTLLAPGFSHYVAQWQPTTLSPASLPTFLLALGFVWLLGRAGDAYTGFEKLLGLLLVTLALLAVRNWVWLALYAIAFCPRGLDRARRRPARREAPGASTLAALAGILVCAVSLAAVLAQPRSWLTAEYPEAAAQTVADVARRHPAATVYATERYADWLLWRDPSLAGRIAYDARFELLGEEELRAIALLRATATGLPQTLRRYDVVLLDRRSDRRAVAALGDRAALYEDDHVVVVPGRASR